MGGGFTLPWMLEATLGLAQGANSTASSCSAIPFLEVGNGGEACDHYY